MLERFGGIAWSGDTQPPMGRDGFSNKLNELRRSLDRAQEAALHLDDCWGRVQQGDLQPGDVVHRAQSDEKDKPGANGDGSPTTADKPTSIPAPVVDVEAWWQQVRDNPPDNAPAVRHVVEAYHRAHRHLMGAEGLLRPWVIRHLKTRELPAPHHGVARRIRLPGRAIVDGCAEDKVRPGQLAPALQESAGSASSGWMTGVQREEAAETLSGSLKAGLQQMEPAGIGVDASGMCLRELLSNFFRFLCERCGAHDRQRYVEAMLAVQTGTHRGADAAGVYAADEIDDSPNQMLLPNVRLVNGSVKHATRQRLMLTFNTPFYPEVLIASSVMAEGVDLHLCCRYIIHHDLCWNPSMLEQRTGRIDRIGAKVEQCGRPIHVFLPYIAQTQDEKMYRVVMDRDRWFNIVMGERIQLDARTTDRLAQRIGVPQSLADELQFRLEVG